ncbi:carbohydrate esterase family 8 protein [Lophiostoma macrostomum CBS 122681]|uniref:pectinesterase n=1 Tax=Lophiostoma macrostomum CBS 122681 TaxID=1314788 RepID=A0A6A6TBA9_9PLEO|nr:carbohydrate esterase family 8 protein [Lophiostoma macrostomum CBS 122681]
MASGSRSAFSFYFLSILSIFATLSSTLSTEQRHACQSPTPNPLTGCPPNTLLVDPSSASNSTTNSTNVFTTIQSAILSLPHDNSTSTILILPGLYPEQLNITRPGPLTLLSQTASPLSLSSNAVEILFRSATNTSSFDNAFTSVLTVAPTLNSSLTGSGPTGNPVPADTPLGNSNFRAYNLNFTNGFADYSAGPSLALSVSYAQTSFYGCAFKSYQDTVYIGKWGSAYMRACEVSGQTDFLYGFGTLWIEDSSLLLRSCGGGITAWKGTNTTYANKFGAYIHASAVRAANSSIAEQIVGKCALGRPWNAQHRSIFAENYLDASIIPSGYIDWSATDPRVSNWTFMAEYGDFGPGWNLTGRVEGNVTRVLNESQWEAYSSPAKVFQYFMSGEMGNVGWIDPDA